MTTSRHLLALTAIGLGSASGLCGGLGTWIAVGATARDLGLGDGGELALVVVPALAALLGGGLATLLGLVPLLSGGSPGSARALGAVGALIGGGVVVVAGGYAAFVGGLWALAALAWG